MQYLACQHGCRDTVCDITGCTRKRNDSHEPADTTTDLDLGAVSRSALGFVPYLASVKMNDVHELKLLTYSQPSEFTSIGEA
eukprot:3454187-Pleurochrysis_carterae.AAC.2